MFTVMSFLRVHGWRLSEVLTNECTTLSQIANSVPVYEVTIPWSLDHCRCRLSTSEMLIALFVYFLWWLLNGNDAEPNLVRSSSDSSRALVLRSRPSSICSTLRRRVLEAAGSLA